MKAYKLELLIIDHDKVGSEGIRTTLENTAYPNRCINPEIKSIVEKDIGEWSDEHPLNHSNTCDLTYKKLFGIDEQERGNVIAKAVWDWIQEKENLELVPWVKDPTCSEYNPTEVNEFTGYQICLAELKEFIITKSIELKRK